MPGAGAANDPKWLENELDMLERSLGMYQAYAANAEKNKVEKAAWEKRLHDMEERISETKEKLKKARTRLGIAN